MANILHFPTQQRRCDLREKYTGEMLNTMIETVNRIGRKHEREFQCSTCTKEFKESDKITSDILPDSLFCSPECRNEAENEAENTRRTDIRPGSY